MKYRVMIPRPKTAKMVGKVVVSFSDFDKELVTDIKENQEVFEFNVPNGYVYFYDGNKKDKWFKVEVIYSNKEKSRKETVRVVPEAV